MDISQMIERAGRGDSAAVAALWELVLAATLLPMRRAAGAWTKNEATLDDWRQDFCAYFQANSLHLLSAFHGNTEGQFRSFIRRVAMRFVQRMARKWARAEHQAAEAAQHQKPPDHSGPTEEEIEAVLHYLEPRVSPADRVKLAIIASRSAMLAGTEIAKAAAVESVSDRTLRRYCVEMYKRYGDLVRSFCISHS